METFRRLFSCGPIFAKKTEEEEGDAAKEVPLPPVLALPLLRASFIHSSRTFFAYSAASHARSCCRRRRPLPVL